MKSTAKVAKKPSAPQSDAEALVDIVTWSADRPGWQRDTLRLLVASDQPSSEHVDALYGLALAAGTATAPLTATDVRSTTARTAQVTLKSVGKPEDVNALASDQTLTFEKSGLTIVYGDNGAGKSGYARILKHACRARVDGKGQPILPNIDTQTPGSPRAKIAYVVNTQNRHVDWQIDKPTPADLSAISVFDTGTARLHVDGVNEVAYVPFALDLLQRLAKVADVVRERARAAKSTLDAQTPQALRAPPIEPGTSVAKSLTALSATAKFANFEVVAKLAPQDTVKLADLKRDLSGDPAATARQLHDASSGLGRFSALIRALCQVASNDALADLRHLRATRDTTRAAADAAAKNRFASEPLQMVGSDAWKSLWDAARRYATTEASSAKPFPPSTTSEHCPLCQQALAQPAIDRFARFEAFVRDDTRQQADRAEKAYVDRLEEIRKVMPEPQQLARQLRYIRDTLRDADAYLSTARTTIVALHQSRHVLRSHEVTTFTVADIDPMPAVMTLTTLSGRLAERATAITADAKSAARVALLTELNELEARTWLKGMLPDIKAEIERRQQTVALDRVIAEADTRAITQKASQLAELLVTDALRAQFTKEIAAIGVADLAVELKKEASQAGAARFRVRLIRKPSAAVGAVLSEGEHRCVALAAFLAELATSGDKSAIIFDDPVSSLDHRHRGEVAARLAVEARHRQVIVLTHDIAFLMLLHHASQETQTHVGFRCIARGTQQAGYCSHEPPFNARPIDDVLTAIETNVANKKIHFERGNQSDWRNTVRGTLEQLRETWERAVEEFIGPVLKRLAHKVDTSKLARLTVLDVKDCDVMREGYGRCSELLHSVGESLNPKLPTPDELNAEIAALRQWHLDLRARQGKVKAA
jgi:energy-coupling factor transporter ATP-binding protein EcfA2